MYSIIVSNQKYASTKQTNKRNNANEIKWQTLKSRGIFYSFLIFFDFSMGISRIFQLLGYWHNE